MDLNTTGFTGKVISTQELRYVGDSAKAVLKFRFRVYQGKFKGEHKSIFLDGECWGPHAEFLANVLAKDVRVGVAGRLDMDEYDANDGSGKRQAWKVANAQVTVLDQTGGAGSGAKNDDDTVPF